MNTPIILPASELRIALAGLQKVAGKSSLSVTSYIRIARTEPGVVTLQATDLDTLVSYRLDHFQPGIALELIVPLDPLASAAKNAKEKLGLLLEGEDQLFLLSYIGNISLEEPMQTLHPTKWPVFPHLEKGFMLEAGFPSALKEALDCAGHDPTRPELSGALLDVSQAQAHFLVGADGSHLYAANSFCFELEHSLLLPNHKFLHWPAFLEDRDWQLALWLDAEKKPCWIKVKSRHWTFLTKAPEGHYPAWRQVLPEPERQKTVVVLNERAKSCLLQAVPQMPGRGRYAEPVTLAVKDNQLWLRGRHGGSNFWTELAVPEASVTGMPIEVCLRRNHLLKALQMDMMHIELSPDGVPILFWKEGKMLIVAPLREGGPQTNATENPPASPQACSAEPDQPPQTVTGVHEGLPEQVLASADRDETQKTEQASLAVAV